MNSIDSNFKIDRSEGTVFAYSKGIRDRLIREVREFERNRVIAEHKAIESARELVLAG